MSWLRLSGFEAKEPQLISDAAGNLTEVLVHVRPVDDVYPVCCLAQKLVKNGSKTVRYRDRRIEPAPTWLVVRRQRMRCRSCDSTLYQAVPHVDDKHYVTERLARDLALSGSKRGFRDAVAMHAVEETLVRRIFRKFADNHLLDYRFEAPRVLGIDENNLLGAMRGVVVDVEAGKLLDVYPGRTQSDIRRGLARMDNWDRVEVWCQDMSGPYKGIARDLFPDAAIVVDKFHVLSKANYWWSRIRVAETPRLPKEVKHLMPGLVRLFDRHWETMTDRQQDRVAEVFEYSERLKMAWTIKERFYYFYDAPDRKTAEAAYTDWVHFVVSSGQHADWKRLMTMVQRWRSEIFNYFDHRFTSAAVERMNRSVADINRAGNGMDFQTLRAKAILRHGRVLPDGALDHYISDRSTRYAG